MSFVIFGAHTVPYPSSLVARRFSVAALCALSSVAANFLCASAAHAQSSTVAWYKFAEGIAGTPATAPILDSSGNGLNGMPFSAPVYQSVPVGDSGLGLRFTGTPQRVFVPDNPLLALTHSLTLEAFIQYTGIVASGEISSEIVFRGDDRGGYDPYFLTINTDGKLNFTINDSANAGISIFSPAAIPIGQFLHVAGTLDDTTGAMRLFVNGVQVNSTTTALRPAGSLVSSQIPGLGIGDVQSSNYNEGFHGVISDVRISNIALSPGQFLNAPVAVPEPGSLALLVPAALDMVGFLRRRK